MRVLYPLPKITARLFAAEDTSRTLFDGEHRATRLIIENVGRLPVDQLQFHIKQDKSHKSDSLSDVQCQITWDYNDIVEKLPLLPGNSITLEIHIDAHTSGR